MHRSQTTGDDDFFVAGVVVEREEEPPVELGWVELFQGVNRSDVGIIGWHLTWCENYYGTPALGLALCDTDVAIAAVSPFRKHKQLALGEGFG